jgi:hypothetical protein
MAKRITSKKSGTKGTNKGKTSKRRTQKGGDLLKPWTWFAKKPAEIAPVVEGPVSVPVLPPTPAAPTTEIKEEQLKAEVQPTSEHPIIAKVGGRRKRKSRAGK